MVKTDETDYKKYIVKRNSNAYWSVEEKVQVILMGLSKQVTITTLCRINKLIPALYYEWKELFIAGGKEGLLGKNSRSEREINCEKKVNALERFIGELVLEKELLKKYGHPCAEALAESAINWAEFFEKRGFKNFKLSIKSSDIQEMVNANIMVSKQTDAPLHIGLTEAGTLVSGLVRSVLGVSKLLEKGIGDTIRISLSSNPVNEVIAGRELLKAMGLRTGIQVISCPTCTRTEIDVENIAESIEREFAGIEIPVKVAVMGCIVNGPGEAKEADIGIAGGKDGVALFINGKIIKKLPIENAYIEIKKYITEKISAGGK